MDLRNNIEQKKFLTVFGSPLTSMCFYFTLQSGFIIIAIYDILSGIGNIISLIFGIMLIAKADFIAILDIFLVLSPLARIAALPFALIGVRGMAKMNLVDILKYSRFKIIELFALGVLNIGEVILIDSFSLQPDPNFFLDISLILIFRSISGYFVKVIWSVSIKNKDEKDDRLSLLKGRQDIDLQELKTRQNLD